MILGGSRLFKNGFQVLLAIALIVGIPMITAAAETQPSVVGQAASATQETQTAAQAEAVPDGN